MQKKHILLAEDNKDLAYLVGATLGFLGYEVTIARDGIEAVDQAISLSPDLIIMDMLMPRMDGFQAVQQLRRHSETKNIPILAVTALASAKDRERCLASGCDDYISKPFTHKALEGAIERLLRGSSAAKPKPAKTSVDH